MLKRSLALGGVLVTLGTSLGISFLYAESIPSPSPSVLGAPSPVTLNKNILLREFLRAQKSEIKAIEHRYKYEQNELKASQDAREKEWKKVETEARHKYFESHAKGSDRRTYIHDFLQRRDALHKLFLEERNQNKQELEAKIMVIRKDQSLRLQDFKTALEGGRMPSQTLWPSPGR